MHFHENKIIHGKTEATGLMGVPAFPHLPKVESKKSYKKIAQLVFNRLLS